ncbi:MAG: hypothetical protein Q9170_006183 [Blastenia crenularia]
MKTKWTTVRPTQTEKPKTPVEVKARAPPPPASTKKGGRAHQKLVDRWHKYKEKADKPKTVRGEERPPNRTHHCAICKKAFSHICRTKEHMVPCTQHPLNYKIPGRAGCAECNVAEDSRARKLAKAVEEEKERIEKEKQNAFFLDEFKRKKAPIKITPCLGTV